MWKRDYVIRAMISFLLMQALLPFSDAEASQGYGLPSRDELAGIHDLTDALGEASADWLGKELEGPSAYPDAIANFNHQAAGLLYFTWACNDPSSQALPEEFLSLLSSASLPGEIGPHMHAIRKKAYELGLLQHKLCNQRFLSNYRTRYAASRLRLETMIRSFGRAEDTTLIHVISVTDDELSRLGLELRADVERAGRSPPVYHDRLLAEINAWRPTLDENIKEVLSRFVFDAASRYHKEWACSTGRARDVKQEAFDLLGVIGSSRMPVFLSAFRQELARLGYPSLPFCTGLDTNRSVYNHDLMRLKGALLD
jgi:hypothetical protein